MADGPNKVDRSVEPPVVVEDASGAVAPQGALATSSQGATVTDDTVLRTAAGELDRLGAHGDPSGELARSARLSAPRLILDSPVPPVRPRTDSSEPLTEFLGLIIAGLRLEHAGLLRLPYEQILRMENFEGLRAEIERIIPITPASIDDDVHQSWDPDRSIVELASNALDAGPDDINVTVTNGFYEVLDTGCGMDAETIVKSFLVAKLTGKPDPAKTIGRFGIGFYTAYRHLQRAGDHLIVETKVEGSKGWRLHFYFYDGEIRLATEEITGEVKNGTRIRVYSGSIQRERMEAELDRYLRYVPDQTVWVNGHRLNQNEQLVAPDMVSLSNHDASRVKFNPHRSPGIAVQVGKVVIEQYPATGHILPGELVIQLSQEEGHSVARTDVVVNERLVKKFSEIVDSVDGQGSLQAKIAFLNTLAPLAEAFDSNGRNPTETSFTDLLRRKVDSLVPKTTEIYPDTELPLFPPPDSILVAPSILPHGWTTHFASPPEFKSGKTIDTTRLDGLREMKVVLSKNLDASFYYDRTHGILFISEKIYRQTPAVADGGRAPADMVPAPADMVSLPNHAPSTSETTPDAFPPAYAVLRLIPDGEKIAAELERRGLSVPSVPFLPDSQSQDVGPLSDYIPFLYKGRVFVLHMSAVFSTGGEGSGNFGGDIPVAAYHFRSQIVEDSGELLFLTGDRKEVRRQVAMSPTSRQVFEVDGKLEPFFADGRWMALKIREKDGMVFLIGDGTSPRTHKGVRRRVATTVFGYKVKTPDGRELKVEWTDKGWKVTDDAGKVLLDFEGRYFRPVSTGGKLFFKGVKDYKVQVKQSELGGGKAGFSVGMGAYLPFARDHSPGGATLFRDRQEWLKQFEMDNVFQIFEYQPSEESKPASLPKISSFQAIDVNPVVVDGNSLLEVRLEPGVSAGPWDKITAYDLVYPDQRLTRFFGRNLHALFSIHEGRLLTQRMRYRVALQKSLHDHLPVFFHTYRDIQFRNGIFLLRDEHGFEQKVIVLEHLKKLSDPKYLDRLEAVKDRPMTDALYNALFNFSDASLKVTLGKWYLDDNVKRRSLT